MTLRELANIANCSVSTVSLALRNHPRISDEVKARIQQLATEHGYKRDPVVSTLINHLRAGGQAKTKQTIAVLTWWSTRSGERKLSLGVKGHEGIRNRAAELGFEIEEFWAREPGMTNKRLSNILYTRAIRGIILSSMPRARSHVSLNWSHFAVAASGSALHKPAVHRVTYSLYDGMLLAIRRLQELGYKRIGYTNLTTQEDMGNDAWLAAYLSHSFRTGGAINLPPLLLGEWSKAEFASWLKRHRPDVILSNYVQPYEMMLELGYKIPVDIGYASLDCVPERLTCSGIWQTRDRVGANLVDLVAAQLRTHEFGLPSAPKTIFLKGVWKDGGTVLDREK